MFHSMVIMTSPRGKRSLQKNIFLGTEHIFSSVNYKRLEALLHLKIQAMLYFKNVQPCIDVVITHQTLQTEINMAAGGKFEFLK